MDRYDRYIKKILVIKETGLPVFQSSSIDEDQDQVLLSGFLAASLAFSKHLGTEVTSINIGQLIYYFKMINSLIVITGTEEEVHTKDMDKFFQQIETSEQFREFAEHTLKSDAVISNTSNTENIHRLFLQILDDLNLSPASGKSTISSIDDLILIGEIVYKFKDGVSAKELAEEIFGQGLDQYDKTYIQSRIVIIDNFVTSVTIQPTVKQQLKDLTTFLKRTLRASNILGF